MKKVIYTQRVEVIESYKERRDCADQRIADFIYACGYLPIPIPNREELIESFIEEVKPCGIVLTGGNSLVKYGGNAPERDAVDCILIRMAIREGIPVYGFCRGMQSILNYFGNALVNVQGHVATRHEINSANGIREVNSYHNQACIELQKDGELEIISQCSDGVIEEVKHRTLRILGTMWHPEREVLFQETDIEKVKKLFKD